MKTFLVVVVIAALVVALYLWMRNRPEAGKPRGASRKRSAPGGPRLVQLRAGPGACSLARQQAGRVYQGAEQPRLPLPGCRADQCLCRFEGIVERRRRVRREKADRREAVRFGAGTSDRRSGGDRRTGSRDPWSTGI